MGYGGGRVKVPAFRQVLAKWNGEGLPGQSEIPVSFWGARSDFVVRYHSDDYISLFAPLVNISMSLYDLFQRISSIYDRSYLFCLNQLFEENQVFSSFGCHPKYCFLATNHLDP
jgi:hypothetical protein